MAYMTFNDQFTPICENLRGHVYSTNPDNKFTHREAANDVFLLLEKLGIGHFSVMGISSGGMTLLHMATSQTERIDSKVLNRLELQRMGPTQYPNHPRLFPVLRFGSRR